MNDFKKALRSEKRENKKNRKIKSKPQKWQFYKTYKKGKNENKIYKSRISTKNELNQNDYLGGVSCFILDENGNILIEKRGNTKITAGEIDLCSGHIDNNETPTQAMIREYIEELHKGDQKEQEQARSEAIANLKKLEELDLVFKNKGNERKFFIQFYVMKTRVMNFTVQKDEVEDIDWIPMEEVFNLIRQNKTKFPYDRRYEKIFRQVKEHYQGKNKEDKQIENI